MQRHPITRRILNTAASAALAGAVAASASVPAAAADQSPPEVLSRTERGVFDTGDVAENPRGYVATELAAFDGNDLVRDRYGYYDSDFDWRTVDAEANDWLDADTGPWTSKAEEDGFWDW